VRSHPHPFQLATALLVVCGLILGGLYWMRRREPMPPAELVALLPARPGTVVYLDFASARRAGLLRLLNGSESQQDADYRQFVARTRFDYQRDLDAAAILFANGEEFFALRGRFDWESLAAYAEQQGGVCREGVCRMSGSRPDRKISFDLERDDVLDLAVSTDGEAVRQIHHRRDPEPADTPAGAVWVKTSAQAITASGLLPEPARPLLASMAGTQPIVFTLSARGTGLVLEAQLDCQDPPAATQLEAELESGTAALRTALAQHSSGAGADTASLGGVLASGTFHCDRNHLTAEWPLPDQFLAALSEDGAN
jgi:hypothetical protein